MKTDDDAPPPPRSHLRLVHARGPEESIEDARPVEREDDAAARAEGAAAPDGSVDEPPAPALSPRFVVIALLAFQALGTLSYLGKYVELTRSGTVSPAAAMLSLPAALALYVGALLLALRPGRGRTPFLVAAVGFGVAVPFWGISYDWTWPIAFGSMIGLAGAWYARPPAAPEPDDDETDPLTLHDDRPRRLH